eukprot:6190643-Pleurochrysis_carterae.AAC.2
MTDDDNQFHCRETIYCIPNVTVTGPGRCSQTGCGAWRQEEGCFSMALILIFRSLAMHASRP